MPRKRADVILRKFFFNDKNPLYIPRTSALQVFFRPINFETNPPSPNINVVCKYLSQFLGTSFGVATLPIYCNIE